jgi:hypothetical protein
LDNLDKIDLLPYLINQGDGYVDYTISNDCVYIIYNIIQDEPRAFRIFDIFCWSFSAFFNGQQCVKWRTSFISKCYALSLHIYNDHLEIYDSDSFTGETFGCLSIHDGTIIMCGEIQNVDSKILRHSLHYNDYIRTFNDYEFMIDRINFPDGIIPPEGRHFDKGNIMLNQQLYYSYEYSWCNPLIMIDGTVIILRHDNSITTSRNLSELFKKCKFLTYENEILTIK